MESPILRFCWYHSFKTNDIISASLPILPFLKIVLAIMGPLYFHVNMLYLHGYTHTIHIQVDIHKKPANVWKGSHRNIWWFEDGWYLYNIESFKVWTCYIPQVFYIFFNFSQQCLMVFCAYILYHFQFILR